MSNWDDYFGVKRVYRLERRLLILFTNGYD